MFISCQLDVIVKKNQSGDIKNIYSINYDTP